MSFTSFPSVFGLGLVFLDVLVEGAAGVGHEHVLEAGGATLLGRHHGLEAFGRVLGDDAAAVEDRDASAEALRLGQVVGREDDRGVVRSPGAPR